MVHTRTISALRWVLAAVILFEAVHCILSSSAAHHFGVPPWVSPTVCGSELAAVILFMIAATRVIGGYLLLAILAIAIVIHVSHSQFDVGALIVYGMAVIVCMPEPAEAFDER